MAVIRSARYVDDVTGKPIPDGKVAHVYVKTDAGNRKASVNADTLGALLSDALTSKMTAVATRERKSKGEGDADAATAENAA